MSETALLREQNALLAEQLRIKDARIDDLLNDQREARNAAEARVDALINDLHEARRVTDTLINDLHEAHRSIETQAEQHRRAIETQAEQHRRAIETQAEQHREERKHMVNVFGDKLDNLLVVHEQSRSQIMQKLTTMDSRMTKRPINPGKKHGFALLMTPLNEPGKFELRFIAGQADYVATTTREYPDDQILFPFTETGNPIDLRNNFRQLATERLIERLGGSALEDVLDGNGYCHHHRASEDRQSMTTSRRPLVWDVNSYGRVTLDPVRYSPGLVCQGVYKNTRRQRTKPAKPGYDFCCAAHDPSLLQISPRMFSSTVVTRAGMEGQVVAQYNGRDLYHFDALDLTTPDLFEMDHILEKQCFSHAFRRLDFRDGPGEMEYVAGIVRDEIVNKPANLCVTRKTTNRIKGSAAWKFLDDYVTGHVGHHGNGATFTGYMMAKTRGNVRLERHTTRVITREMGSSLKRIQRQLAAEGDTPILEALSDELQDLYVTMQLHSRARL
ncbi:hypothetical protein FI667_g13428, partial [Globisporangium splendens]